MESFGYVGFFLIGRLFLPVSDFDPKYQNPDIDNQAGDDPSAIYVNNFIYFPDATHATVAIGAIRGFLSRKKPN